ncbi:unnamed protein product [Gordionus sp. m RMFG-2023]
MCSRNVQRQAEVIVPESTGVMETWPREGSDETAEGWTESWPGEQQESDRRVTNLIIPESREAGGTRESNDGQGYITGDE